MSENLPNLSTTNEAGAEPIFHDTIKHPFNVLPDISTREEGLTVPTTIHIKMGSLAAGESNTSYHTELSSIIEAVETNYGLAAHESPTSRRAGKFDTLKTRVEHAYQVIPETGRKGLSEIVSEGSLGGNELPEHLGKWSIGNEEEKLTQFIGIYENDPQLAADIAEHNIVGFHATSSAALWGIFKHGALLSAAEARQRQQTLVSGERQYSTEGGQPSISFADWRAPHTISSYANMAHDDKSVDGLEAQIPILQATVAEYYELFGDRHPYVRNGRDQITDLEEEIKFLRENPDSPEASLILSDFPVVFGLNGDGYNVYDRPRDAVESGEDAIARYVESSYEGEFLVSTREIGLDKTPVVLTVKEKVTELKKLFTDHGYPDIRVADLGVVTNYYSLIT